MTIDNEHTTDLYVDNDTPTDGSEDLSEDKPAANFGDFYESPQSFPVHGDPSLVRGTRRALGREDWHHRAATL